MMFMLLVHKYIRTTVFSFPILHITIFPRRLISSNFSLGKLIHQKLDGPEGEEMDLGKFRSLRNPKTGFSSCTSGVLV